MAFLTNEKYICNDDVEDGEMSEGISEFTETFAGFDMYLYPAFAVRANFHYRCIDSSFTLSFTPMRDNEISECEDVTAIQEITDEFWAEIDKIKKERMEREKKELSEKLIRNETIITKIPSDYSKSEADNVMNQHIIYATNTNGICEVPLPTQFPMEAGSSLPDDITDDKVYYEVEKMMEGC